MKEKEIFEVTKLDKFINNITDPVMLFNMDKELVFFNIAAEKLFQITGKRENKKMTALVDQILLENTEFLEEESCIDQQIFLRKGKRLHFGDSTFIFETLEVPIEKQDNFQYIYSKEIQTIIHTINDGLYISDGKGFTLLVNDKYSEMTGISKEEVQGRHISELVFAGYFDSSVTLEVLTKKTKQSVLQKTKDHENTWLVTGNPIHTSNGKIKMIINSVYDMTELNRLKENLNKQETINSAQKKELERLRSKMKSIPGLIGNSSKIKEVKKKISRVSDIDSTVLIVGETGSGKNIAANAIHDLSDRRSGPFIEVNCGAIPEHLIESELFGYAPGSFTGATKNGKVGLVESADNGTIFLDEIGELPLSLQVKILTFLQDKKIRRVGEVKYRDIDVRVIAATNKELEKLVAENKFREDLYYRLSVVPIVTPSLREYKEDIKLLSEHFLLKFNNQYNRNISISNSAYYYLERYHWPGNVRELQHLIEQLVVLSEKNFIDSIKIPKHIKHKTMKENSKQQGLQDILDDVEKEVIQSKWDELKNMSLVADSLKIHRTTLMRKMNKLHINTK